MESSDAMESLDVNHAHRLLAPRLVVLIGTRGVGGEDLIPISNITSVSTDPEQIAIAVYKEWRTYRNLGAAEGFTVSIPTYRQLDVAWRLGEKYSGFTVPAGDEKIAAAGASVDSEFSRFGHVLEGAYGWLECVIVEAHDHGGDHGLFVANISKTTRNPKLVNDEGEPTAAVSALFQVVGNQFATNSDTVRMPFFRESD